MHHVFCRHHQQRHQRHISCCVHGLRAGTVSVALLAVCATIRSPSSSCLLCRQQVGTNFSACFPCEAGARCTNGTAVPCAPGTYAAASRTACLACPAGYYSNASAANAGGTLASLDNAGLQPSLWLLSGIACCRLLPVSAWWLLCQRAAHAVPTCTILRCDRRIDRSHVPALQPAVQLLPRRRHGSDSVH